MGVNGRPAAFTQPRTNAAPTLLAAALVALRATRLGEWHGRALKLGAGTVAGRLLAAAHALPAPTVAVVDALPASAVPVDVRGPGEQAGGVLPGAVGLPVVADPAFAARVGALDPQASHVICCGPLRLAV